jgi:hypothetical protein
MKQYIFSFIAASLALAGAVPAAAEVITSTDDLTTSITVKLTHNGNPVYYSADDNQVMEATASTDAIATDYDLWAIYPYSDYYYLYNVGAKRFVNALPSSHTVELTLGNINKITPYYVADFNGESGWLLDSAKSLLGFNGDNDECIYLGDHTDVLFTVTGTDRALTTAEQTYIEQYLDEERLTLILAYCEFVDNARTLANDSFDSSYLGDYDVDALASALDNAENYTLEQITSLYNAAVQSRWPKAGHYYRIKNYSRPTASSLNNYLGAESDTKLNIVELNAPTVGGTNGSLRENLCLFTFEYPDATANHVIVKDAAGGTYFGTTTSGNYLPLTTKSHAATYELEPMGDFTRLFRFKLDTSLWLTASGGKNLVPYNKEEDSEQWYIQEVTEITGVTTDDNGYALIQLPCAVELPDGVTAYVATEILTDNDNAVLMESIGSTVPANTPVMLVDANATAAATLTLPVAYDVAAYTGTNLLQGSNVALTTSTSNLTLGSEQNSLAEGSTTIQPNSAYLVADDNLTASSAITFESTETGIDELGSDGDANANKLYDLKGRRVTETSRGLLINGTEHRVILKK